MKVVMEGGTVEVEYIAANHSVSLLAETTLSNDAHFRTRLTMSTAEARKLRGELDRVLVDAELSGNEGPL